MWLSAQLKKSISITLNSSNMQKVLSIFLLALIMAGCSGTSSVSKQPQSPSWVQARPNVPDYYVGIGSARKTTPDYQQAAKQSALADLASDISVVISANSALNAFETHQGFFEDYTSNIRTEVQKELEGYEVAGTWEDQQNYWIYYQLSKETYRRTMDQKKSAAGAKALDFYDKAITANESNDSKSALLMLIKALETIKPFINEDISVTHNGKQIFLGNEIINTLTNTLNALTIKGPKEIEVMLGHPIKSGSLSYTVVNDREIPQKLIPLKMIYSEDINPSSTAITSPEGVASFAIEAVRSRKSSVALKIEFDFASVIKEVTRDFAIGKILLRMKVPVTETHITIIRPKFYVTSEEKNLNQTNDKPILAETFKQKILAMGFPIANTPAEADYIINLKANTQPSGRSGQYVQVNLNLQVNATSREGNTVYTFSNDKINASHFTPEQAGISAYSTAVKRIQNTVVSELIERIIKGDRLY